MKTTAGLWIDHRVAVIVLETNGLETHLEIRSGVEKNPGRFDGIRPNVHAEVDRFKADDSLQREFTGHLDKYYAKVIAAVADAESVFVFGPGEAKGEFKKRMEHAKQGARVTDVETADKMNHGQISAKVREHFKHAEHAAALLKAV